MLPKPDYPLRFHPIFKKRIWGGGDMLQQAVGKDTPDDGIGESWEISDRPDENTLVANGPWAGAPLRRLIESYPGEVLGPGHPPAGRFPLLIKFIQTADDCSLQVHPPDAYARRVHAGENGKTELWYIIAARPEARLFIGFKQPMDEARVRRAIAERGLLDALNGFAVAPGDAFFLPAGRIHGIGKGVLLAEVQQNSDLTYRIFDFLRTDEQGLPRPLQLDQAMAVMNFRDTAKGAVNSAWVPLAAGASRLLADCEAFHVEHLMCQGTMVGPTHNRFQVLIVTSGLGALRYAGGRDRLRAGDVLLLPAALAAWELEPGAEGLHCLRVWL